VSRHFNKTDTYVNTGLLRDHVSKLRQQKKIALRLYDNIAAMKSIDIPENFYKYNSILMNIERMIEYFDRMSRALEHIGEDATQISRLLGNKIEDDTQRVRHETSNTFLL
jgi:hypothetical protein